jgi:putative hydrolase of HD superfamily
MYLAGVSEVGERADGAGGAESVAASPRLRAQLGFILEADRLKGVLRRSVLTDGSRRENDAEHSWHLALMAVVLAEYAPPGLDLARVLQMLVVHDLVEIDAGDSFVYDEAAQATKAEREAAAAERIFGLLPAGQGGRLAMLWEEFEARQTPEARFAAAMDRLEPLLLNFQTAGATWRPNGIRREQVVARNRVIADGSPTLWAFVERLIDEAVARGYLEDGHPRQDGSPAPESPGGDAERGGA